MKKTFQVHLVKNLTVCIPSTDYYRNKNDWNEESVKTLVFLEEFQSEGEAIESIFLYKNSYGYKKESEFVILPVFKFSE